MTLPGRVLTKAQFYKRAVPTFVFIVLWTAMMVQLSRMVLANPDPAYGAPNIKMLHMICIDAFAASVVLMLVTLRYAIEVQWCLSLLGGALWVAGRFQDQMVVTSMLLVLVPLLGTWLRGLKENVVTQTTPVVQ